MKSNSKDHHRHTLLVLKELDKAEKEAKKDIREEYPRNQVVPDNEELILKDLEEYEDEND